mmetsp:Transcript_42825/g.99773  ORF Transcript_42825/g.99773 Transcript_42825/m.99773 type:complete len:332 (-) Transcript_42825:119-1114(-)
MGRSRRLGPSSSFHSSNPVVLGLGLVVAAVAFAASCDHSAFVAGVARPSQVQHASVAAAQVPPSLPRPAVSAWPAAMLATVAVASAALRSKPRRAPRAQVVMTRCLPVTSMAPQVSDTQLPSTSPLAAAGEDLLSFDTTPIEVSPQAAEVSVPQNDSSIASLQDAAVGPRPSPRRSRDPRQARARRERRRIGSRLIQRDYMDCNTSLRSFDPSKVPLVLQEAMQHGPRPRTASGRESKPLVEAPGLSASLDIGLKSFNVASTKHIENRENLRSRGHFIPDGATESRSCCSESQLLLPRQLKSGSQRLLCEGGVWNAQMLGSWSLTLTALFQ